MSGWHWHDFHHGDGVRSALRWGVGGALILAAHGAAVYGGLFWHKAEASAEPPAAVMIELAPLPVAPSSEVEEVAPGPQMVQAPEPVPEEAEKPDEEKPEPEAEPVEEKVEEKVPDEKPEPVVEKVEEKPPEVAPSPTQSEVVLPQDVPVPQKRPELEKPPEKPKPVERPKERKRAKPSRSPPAPVTSAAPRSDAPPSQTTAAPSAGATASQSAQRADWVSSVSAQLNRNKRYPPGVQGMFGRPTVRFALDSSGRVISASLVRSSGSPALDEEAVATVRRSSPFPAPPAHMPRPVLTVPINFTPGR